MKSCCISRITAKLLQEALNISRRVLGEEHRNTLLSMSGLADIYLDLGRLDDAETLDRDALEVQRRVLGKEHPDTLGTMNGLADVYMSQGRYDEADRLFGETLHGMRRVLGDDHPDTASPIYGLGCVAALRRERGKALDWLRQAVEHGFRDADEMAKDPNLRSLQGDPAFEALVARARKNAGR